jgi:lysophospholipase-2
VLTLLSLGEAPYQATMAEPSAFPMPHVILPKSNHTHTIIILHGRGSNGPEFAEDLFQGRSSSNRSLEDHLEGWKWVFPTCQERYSTILEGRLEEWFDIYSLTNPEERQELQVKGLRQSISFVRGLVEEESKLVPYNRIVLGGISQGCATSIHALLFSGHKLGAYLGLCGWIPFEIQVKEIAKSKRGPELLSCLTNFYTATLGLDSSNSTPGTLTDSAISTPVFLCHASDDEVIDVSLGKQICEVLKGLGMKVEWNEYRRCGHWIKEPQGFNAIVQFLKIEVESRS